MQAKEERVTAASRRLMAQVNAFKTGTEATKTAYTAAEEAAQAVWTEVTGKTGAAAHTDGTSPHLRAVSVPDACPIKRSPGGFGGHSRTDDTPSHLAGSPPVPGVRSRSI